MEVLLAGSWPAVYIILIPVIDEVLLSCAIEGAVAIGPHTEVGVTIPILSSSVLKAEVEIENNAVHVMKKLYPFSFTP